MSKLLRKLSEAGRRNSSSDLQVLNAIHDSAVTLGASCGTSEATRVDDPEMHTSDAFLETILMSHSDVASLLRTALRAEYPGDRTYVWTRDVYDDRVVYSVENGAEGMEALYQRSYSILDGVVTFGDPVKVIAVTNYVAVTEAGGQVADNTSTAVTVESQDITSDLVPLVEKAVKKDGTGMIKIIAPGQGSSGYYPADVLKRDGPKVFVEGTHVYLDHPSASEASDRPERSVKDLAGSLTGAAIWQEEGVAGPGLYAPVKFIDSVAPHINDIAAISGMSIRAGGTMGAREMEGKKVRTIESIDVAHSVDVVTKPGAGGKVLDLIESARNRQPVTPAEGVTEVDKVALEEAQKKITDLEAREAERIKEINNLKQWKENQEQRERDAKLLREAHKVVVDTLVTIALPKLVHDRLTGQLASNPPLTEAGGLDEDALKAQVAKAATAELDYLNEAMGGTGRVVGMGGTTVSDTDVEAELTAFYEAKGHSKEIAARMAR